MNKTTIQYKITLEVLRREFEPGKEKSHDFEFLFVHNDTVPNKYNLFVGCLRAFGRCAKRIPMGWIFERKEVFDDGSTRWVEYQVKLIKGAEPVPGFKLVNK